MRLYRNLGFLLTSALATAALTLGAVACEETTEDAAAENNSAANNSTANNSTANNSTANNSTANNSAGNNNPEPIRYRFVLVEDLSTDTEGTETPGSDIDAIGIDLNNDGTIDHWASSAEDFNIAGDNNAYADVNDLLGPPDSECMVQNFTSLGGAINDGYVIVGFAVEGSEEDVTFGTGDAIFVAELGPTGCDDQPQWKDDPTRVSVSVSNDREAFTLVGNLGEGANAIILE